MATQGSHTPQGWIVGCGALAVRADAVERARDDARRRRLAHAAHAGEHEGMRDAARRERVRQRAHQRLLPDQAGEIGRAVFARQHAIGLGLLRRQGRSPDRVRPWGDYSKPARRVARPEPISVEKVEARPRPEADSLRLLPSGPDRVGERLVRNRTSGRRYKGLFERMRVPRSSPVLTGEVARSAGRGTSPSAR